jgi:hypothetical protein
MLVIETMANQTSRLTSSVAIGRFQARFNPGGSVFAFVDGSRLDVLDISESGFRLKAASYKVGDILKPDIVFNDELGISGWRINVECVWTTEEEAGFRFILGRFARCLSSRLAKSHFNKPLKVLSGNEV